MRVLGIVGHDHLGHQDAARRGHEGCGQKIRQVTLPQQACISREDGSGDARHSDAHHGEQARRRKRREIGADDQRRLGLADEDVGRGGQRFDPADPRHPADRSADPADDPLHDPEIIEDRDQAGEEDDDRQSSDRERIGERVLVRWPEQELGAFPGISEQVGHSEREPLDRRLAPAGPQHQPGDQGLECEGSADDSWADRLAIRR